jgi:hypothetical protein
VEELREKEVLWCIDRDQELAIRGMDEIDSVSLNVDLMPCKPSELNNYTCSDQTLDQLKDYLGRPELIIYQNNQRFDSTVYDENCIVNESTIWNQHIDKRQPNWMLTYLNAEGVEDDIRYLDLGLQ